MENVLNYNYSENEGKKTLTLSIVINDPSDLFYNDLMDALGDVDCVSAIELHPDWILDTDNNLYELDVNDIAKLDDGEEVTLTSIGTVEELADPVEDADFLAWLYGTDKDED